MLWTLLPIAILLAAAAYVAFAVRRTRREHRARSDERAALLLTAMHGRGGEARDDVGAGAPSAGTGAAADPTGSVTDDPTAPPSLAELRRSRFLTEPQRLLYLILRAALPDHIVMANVRTIDLLDVPAGPEVLQRDPRLPDLLHQRLDCVVCRQDLVPLAAIVVHAAAMPRAPDEQKQALALRELGIRFLRVRADSLPRPAEMRALVLDQGKGAS